MKALEELTREIRDKLPRLKDRYYSRRLCRMINHKRIMLNDVLEWLNDDSISVYCDGCFCHAETGLYYLENGNDIIKWDMSKPYLKDQSPELINFLHGLIKK